MSGSRPQFDLLASMDDWGEDSKDDPSIDDIDSEGPLEPLQEGAHVGEHATGSSHLVAELGNVDAAPNEALGECCIGRFESHTRPRPTPGFTYRAL